MEGKKIINQKRKQHLLLNKDDILPNMLQF